MKRVALSISEYKSLEMRIEENDRKEGNPGYEGEKHTLRKSKVRNCT
jgi:hypothetical protein